MICNEFLSSKCSICSKLCCEDSSGSKITCVENGKRYTINNLKTAPLTISKYHIDGGVFQESEIRRCDYAFYHANCFVVFIELKGTDYNHALTQIQSTVKQLEPNLAGIKIYGRVIASRCPNMSNDPNTLKIREEFARRGGNFISKSKTFEENISNFL